MSNMSNLETNRNIIIVDDDQIWLNQLSRAFERRDHNTYVAKSVSEAKDIIFKNDIHYGVIDLRLDDGDGLEVILELQKKNPKSRSVILTGFGNIANAVSAIKIGAIDYLSKPAGIDDICAALFAPPSEKASPPEEPRSANRVRWEHIQRVYELCDKNVSETAISLKMHRRTLQRILTKRATN